jgi:hypothetical protein
MGKFKQLLPAVAGVAALAAAIPALGLAGKPIISGPYPETWCGVVEGTAVDTIVVDFSRDAGGRTTEHFRVTSLFTATATGRSIESSGAGVATATAIDNGDGTTTFVGTSAGLALQFKIPNGPVLKDASGKPLLGAGELTSTETYDAAGNFISGTTSFHGPHPLEEGVDICGPSVAYLMDP